VKKKLESYYIKTTHNLFSKVEGGGGLLKLEEGVSS